MQEARDFIKNKSHEIQKHLTKEHRKLIDRFIAYKERTEERLEHVDKLEATVKEMAMKEALDGPTKEGMYALDAANPLKLYDCLLPEIAAYRPLRRPITAAKSKANYEAKLRLKETELQIVSAEYNSDLIDLYDFRWSIESHDFKEKINCCTLNTTSSVTNSIL